MVILFVVFIVVVIALTCVFATWSRRYLLRSELMEEIEDWLEDQSRS